MGKHDKVEPATTFSWQPMSDEYYKARIKTLEKENLKLAEKVDELEKTVQLFEAMVDQNKGMYITRAEFDDLEEEYEEMHQKYVNELRLNEELKDALVRAALREV